MTERPTQASSDSPVLLKIPVQWGDQDAFGHVNNTRSIRWFEKKKAWQKEINLMLENGFKLEVEALISKDISYVTEEYVPARLADGDFLD